MRTCAIVILNYNGRETLLTFLPSVISKSSHDIWIIDNGSTDDSIDFLTQNYPEVRLLKSVENFGYAGGYNWGLEQLKGKYDVYILLNSDVEVTPNWDDRLVSALNSRPDCAAIQPKILSWTERTKFDYAGAGGGFIDAFGYPFCRGRILDAIEEDSGQYDDAIEVDWASGACFIIRAEIFHQMEGFDDRFFAHMEEIDLCWRMRNSGWKIGYRGDISIFHLGGGTLDRNNPKKLYLNIRNSLTMIYKLEPPANFWKIYIVKSFLEYSVGLFYLISGKNKFAKAIFQGYADFNKSRKRIQKFVSINPINSPIKRKGSVRLILWHYGALRKRRFSSL